MSSDNSLEATRSYSDPVAMRERTLKARADLLAIMGRILDPNTLEMAKRAIDECDALLRDLDGQPKHRTC
ncbi:MAG: hypothetical protein ACJ73D_04030 [Pyrinomonadaceae bacterium]